MQRSHHKLALVLGAGGKLGGLLRSAWAMSPPERIDLVYQSRAPLPENNSVVWSPDKAVEALPACDAVIALWGVTSGDVDALQANVDLAHAARKIAQATGAHSVFHFSSAAVYGDARDAEANTPLAPVNRYGEAKLAMEMQVARFINDTARHCCLRVANVVGADSLGATLSGAAPARLDRFADGQGPERSYIGASDLARVLVALCAVPAATLPVTLNITARTPIRAESLLRAAGKTIEWREAPAPALQHVSLCGKRMRALLSDVTPMTDPYDLIADWRRLKGLS